MDGEHRAENSEAQWISVSSCIKMFQVFSTLWQSSCAMPPRLVLLLPVICQLTESAPASAETWSIGAALGIAWSPPSCAPRLRGMGQRLCRGRDDE